LFSISTLYDAIFILYLLQNQKQTQAEWQVVFYICAVIYFVGAVIYWFFCQTELQSWAVAVHTNIQPEEECLEKKAPTRF
jgi:hypothetical protein